MRIITPGKVEVKEWILTCSKCKTKFAYVAEDKKGDRDGVYVNCPGCAAFIDVTPPSVGDH